MRWSIAADVDDNGLASVRPSVRSVRALRRPTADVAGRPASRINSRLLRQVDIVARHVGVPASEGGGCLPTYDSSYVECVGGN